MIPHRHHFLLVDTIEELEPGVRAVGRKCVTYDEPFFAGHFPQEPVMPGVLQIEALAQTGAAAILSKPENKGKTAYFGGIRQAKFRQKVVPGDVLTLEVELVKVKGPVGVGKAVARNQEGKITSAVELTFMIRYSSGSYVSENLNCKPGRNCSADYPHLQRNGHLHGGCLFGG